MKTPQHPLAWLLEHLASRFHAVEYAELLRRLELQKRHYDKFRAFERARIDLARYRANPLSRREIVVKCESRLAAAERRLQAFREEHAHELTD